MIPIEPFDELGDDDATDVRIGLDRRRVVPVLLAVLAALLVVSFAVGRRAPSVAAPGSSVPPAATVVDRSTTTVVASSTTPAPATTTTTSTTASVVSLPFGEATGLVVYLTPSGGAPDSIRAYDIDTGVVHDVSFGGDIGWYIRAIDGAGGVVVDGGAAVAVGPGGHRTLMAGGPNGINEAPNGRVAAGPSGGVWARGFDPPRIELFDASGAPAGRMYGLPIGAELYGSMADGRPVVRTEDRRVAVIEADGTRTPLADNTLGPVESGRFAEVRCADDEQPCHVLGHVDDRTIDLGLTHDAQGVARGFRFQPDGPFVAVNENGRISLIDSTTGATTSDVAHPTNEGWFGEDDRVPVRFLPGGRGLVASTGFGLELVDLSGTRIAAIYLDGDNGSRQVLGVGYAHPWAP